MGRTREFDIDKALRGAMEVFWRRGYLGTNLPDLLAAMGLTRGSFYKAFGDKESAYLAALDQYDASVVSKTVQMLAHCKAPDAVSCLALLFAPSKDPRRGCFICNAMVELAPGNPRVADKANAMAGRLRGAIADVLRRYGATGTAGTVADTADLVLHLYFGHQAMGKAADRFADGSSGWSSRLAGLVGQPDGTP